MDDDDFDLNPTTPVIKEDTPRDTKDLNEILYGDDELDDDEYSE